MQSGSARLAITNGHASKHSYRYMAVGYTDAMCPDKEVSRMARAHLFVSYSLIIAVRPNRDVGAKHG